MAETQKFRISNTTVKPLKTNARGEDIRPIEDRNGYGIQIVLPNKNPPEYYTLYRPGQSVIVDSVTQEMERMRNKKQISIEVLDIGSVLKEYTESPKTEEPVKASVKDSLAEFNSKSYPMGDVPGVEKLVNPDGEPNFVAKAPRGGLSRVKKTEPQTQPESPAM